MRILYIHQYFITRKSNSGTRSYEFAKRFVESGHQVTIITGDIGLKDKEVPIKKGLIFSEYLIDGIKVIAIKNKYSNRMSNFRRILSFITFLILSTVKGVFIKKHDIVFATSTPLTIGLTGSFVKFFRRIPFVFEVRDLWPEAPIQLGAVKNKFLIALLKKMEKAIYKYSDHIVALSPGMVDGIIDVGISKSKITMIPNSCDLELFNSEKNKTQYYREKYNLKDKFVAIHPGSMGKANGLQYIVEAAGVLQDMGDNNVTILLTGDGFTKPMLEKDCKDKGIKNIIFTGNISKSDMPELIANTDITITSFLNKPILATNSPNKFFDSLAASKPVIVNSNGWTKDMVMDYDIGYFVSPEKPEDLATLLRNLGEDSSNLEKKGQNARKLAESKFDRNKLAIQLEAILVEYSNT